MSNLKIYTDGGARGNPGPAACGAVIKNEKEEIISEISKYIGVATNNQAEYKALILALEEAQNIFKKKKSSKKHIECYLDSELVVKQLKREYKMKNEGLKPLFMEAGNLISNFDSVEFIHIPREQNKLADKLVNKELDLREKQGI